MSKYAEMAKGKLSSASEKASGLKGKAKGKVVRLSRITSHSTSSQHIGSHKMQRHIPQHRLTFSIRQNTYPAEATRTTLTLAKLMLPPH